MAFLYPWGNTQQLNLDWILQKIKELEAGASSQDIEEIANVLVALTYRSSTTYQRYDYAFYNGKLYRAIANTGGVFNPGDWLEVQIGNDVAILTRLVNTVDASLTTLQGQVADLDTDDVDNASNVTGATTSDALNNLNVAINANRKLNILVVGNSFNQDAFAYLPKVLNQMLPNYDIYYCVLYMSSADFQTHITNCLNNTKYTYTNIWDNTEQRWNRYGSGNPNALTLTEALQAKNWDMIFYQATSSDADTETSITNNIITNGRKLNRLILSKLNSNTSPAQYTIEWIARGASIAEINAAYDKIHWATIRTIHELGFNDYVPIGTAFQNARTNATLNALGDGGNMLFSDNVHMQAGFPALLASMVLAEFICRKMGKPNSVYNSNFPPTTNNTIAINAKPSDATYGMVHGDSVGANMNNRRAAQEITILTLNNPASITDCSNVIEAVPT